MIATALIALGMAAVAPWLRQRSAEERKALLAIWGNVGAGMTIAVVAGCAARLHAERQAGTARHRLPLSITRFATVCSIGWALFMLGMVAMLSIASLPMGARVPIFEPTSIQCGVVAALAGLGLWWRAGCLELCDAGLVQACQFTPYKAVRGFRWGSSSPNLLLVQVGWMTVTVRVATADKPSVEQFLQNRLHVPCTTSDG